MLGRGLIPLGAITGGLVAHEFGLRAGYPIAGALRGFALLFGLPVLIAAMRSTKNQAGRMNGGTANSRRQPSMPGARSGVWDCLMLI